MAEPAITVVVPTRDRAQLRAGCLDSLRASLAPADELIVVDSASAPRITPAEVPGARLLRCDQPGASRARNAGWRAARHQFVAFVDDDVRVAPCWADGLRRAFAQSRAAFVTGRIGVAGGRDVERPVALKDEPEPATIGPDTRGTLGHSANMAARREALEAVGGFDEALGAGAPLRAAEDNDLFDRLLAMGYRGCYEPAAAAWHEQWRTRWELVQLDWAYGIGTGARLRKLVVADRRRARWVARAWLWEHALGDVPHAIRHRYEFELAVAAARVAGTALGFAAGALRRVEGGMFAGARWAPSARAGAGAGTR